MHESPRVTRTLRVWVDQSPHTQSYRSRVPLPPLHPPSIERGQMLKRRLSRLLCAGLDPRKRWLALFSFILTIGADP